MSIVKKLRNSLKKNETVKDRYTESAKVTRKPLPFEHKGMSPAITAKMSIL